MGLFEEAKKIPIKDIIGRYTDTGKGNRGTCCPFHKGDGGGAFMIHPLTNKWYCFICGEGGDALDFVAKYRGCSLVQAAKEILDETPGSSFVKHEMPKEEPNRKRDSAYLNTVYSAFIKASPPLSEAHLWQLRGVRKVSKIDLSLFFEWPKDEPLFWDRFKEELFKLDLKGDLREVLRNVPGFYYSRMDERVRFSYSSGIGIVLLSLDGRISALQERLDEGKPKYKLFSSGFAEYDSPGLEKVGGASIGQVPDIAFPKKVKGYAITEGKFKALSLAKKGMLTLSLNGVSIQRPAVEFIKFAKKQGAEKIYIAFDMDLYANKGVKNAAQKLKGTVEDEGLRPLFFKWNLADGKGIDDYFLSKKDSLSVVKFEYLFV